MANERIEVDIVLDDGNIKKAFVDIEQGAKVFAKKTGDAVESGLSRGVSNATSLIKSNLVTLAASFAGLSVIKNAIGDFVAFETALAEVKTVLPDVSQANQALTNSFIDLSAQFGTSAASQAQAFYQIVSAGITDATKANEALESANKLAIGGLTTTGAAIDILTTSINAYGQENLSAEKASDILFGTVRLGKTNVDQLAGSLGLILPTASTLGVGFEDVAGALAALTTKGISTAQGVTQLNAVLTAVISKQQEAKKLGPEVGKAFSLQALQTKGLAKFLKDLNFELGGSEAGLNKLLGSSEATRAVLALSGDNFKTAGDNAKTLATQVGAADAAFNLVSQTTGQQASQALSKLNAIFLKLTTSSSGAIFGIVENLNQGLAFILANFNQIADGITLAIQKIIAGFVAFKTAPIAIGLAQRALSFLKDEYVLLDLRIDAAKGSFKSFTASLKNLSFSSAIAGLKNLRTGLKSARIGLKAFRLAAKLAAASLTLGIGLAVDFLIEKFFELKESFGGIGNLFKFTVLTIRRSFNNLLITIIDFIKRIENIPIIGDKFKSSFGGTFDAVKNDAIKSIEEIEKSFDDLAEKVAKDRGSLPGFRDRKSLLPPQPGPGDINDPDFDQAKFDANKARTNKALEETTKKTKTETKKQIDIAELAWTRIANSIGFSNETIKVSTEELNKAASASFKNIGKAATEGFARSFASIGEAIVKGENAFEAFGKSILGVLGDVAIQAGTLYTLLGIASFNPAQVAAGIALTILGGVLKAVGSGSGGGSSVSSPGGGLDSNPIDGNLSPIDQQTAIGSQVAVNIQGDVLDSQDTGLRIAEILKEQGFQNSVVSA